MFAFLKQSTAAQARMVGPFVDDTDFKTLETALTINNTDVKLSKNAAAGVNKNSGGGTHRNNGMYSLTFDATDTDTVGELTVSISVSGALVVTAKFWVLEEAIYDALFAASANAFTGAAGSTTLTALGTQAKADVNAEVVDALATDTYAEPTGVPGATVSLAAKIGRIYQALRNKMTVSGTKKTFHDDSEAALWEKDLSDDGSVYEESEGNAI